MLKTFTETIYKQLVDLKPGRVIFGKEQRDKILYNAKRVRVKDYLLKARIDDFGKVYFDTVTTTANWFFILTGVRLGGYCFFGQNDQPRIGIKFENFYPGSPFGTEAEKMGMVPSRPCFAVNLSIYEEDRNLFYMLGERVSISAMIESTSAVQKYYGPCEIDVMLTGIEINLQDEGVE